MSGENVSSMDYYDDVKERDRQLVRIGDVWVLPSIDTEDPRVVIPSGDEALSTYERLGDGGVVSRFKQLLSEKAHMILRMGTASDKGVIKPVVENMLAQAVSAGYTHVGELFDNGQNLLKGIGSWVSATIDDEGEDIPPFIAIQSGEGETLEGLFDSDDEGNVFKERILRSSEGNDGHVWHLELPALDGHLLLRVQNMLSSTAQELPSKAGQAPSDRLIAPKLVGAERFPAKPIGRSMKMKPLLLGERQSDTAYQDSQLKAVAEMAEAAYGGLVGSNGFHVFHGGPGLGKTVIMDRIMQWLLHNLNGEDALGAASILRTHGWQETAATIQACKKGLMGTLPAIIFADDVTKSTFPGRIPWNALDGHADEQLVRAFRYGASNSTGFDERIRHGGCHYTTGSQVLGETTRSVYPSCPITVVATSNSPLHERDMRLPVTNHVFPGKAWSSLK
ncbi:hypothetical protein HOD30_05290 [Candidatus Peregrinibacteria bacterium]|jgi:hypothetical protein|nr:hypothetical protein [Candidatus Peregrinibacteria bacterium]MBT4631435.1 hypothetical protein [Candidatus Peregrinibacteria bacterium]MBT5516916.1 hypothetical protein [Candidatus Peregrinibacteria bacterium]MBT5823824.1 hypothetical protein [Candidatus Peregrinibacteria bacterium]